MALQRWLIEASLRECRAHLVEAGGSPDREILLSDVFVDVTVSFDGDDEKSALSLLTNPIPSSKLVLFGGPGEGKSSLTAITALLLRQPWYSGVSDLPVEKARRVQALDRSLDALRPRSERDHEQRIPLRIDLPSFVSRTVSEELTFWDWLALEATALSEDSWWSAERLEATLRGRGRLLWLLDGLDEIAAGPARERLFVKLREMASGTDDVVIATRPQGFEEELAGVGEAIIEPLTLKQANAIAERFTSAWHCGPMERLRVEDALARDEVQGLATTGLHVTLITVVALKRELPANRAALFELFFQTLFRRELEKPTSRDIREEDEDVLLALHGQVGLVLHARSQITHDERWLPESDCASVLFEILVERGVDDEFARRRSSTVLRFARDRLVLLRRLRGDGFAFGVRSLQEYFAARALVDGDASVVAERLAEIARDSYWDNVVELAACELLRAKTAPERERAKRALLGTVKLLDERDTGSANRAPLGASFALWIVEQTRALDALWVQSDLFERALRAATTTIVRGTVGPRRYFIQSIHGRLGEAVYWASEAAQPRWLDHLIRHAHALATEDASLASWALVAPLLARNVPEAVALAGQLEPKGSQQLRRVVDQLRHDRVGSECEWLRDLLVRRWYELIPVIDGGGDARVWFQLDEHTKTGSVVFVDARFSSDAVPVGHDDAPRWHRSTPRSRRRVTVSDAEIHQSEYEFEWRIAIAVQRFNDRPSPSSLREALRAFEAGDEDRVRAVVQKQRLPWPVLACLAWAGERERLSALIARVDSGELGDEAAWRKVDRNMWQDRSLGELLGYDLGDRGPWVLPTEGVSWPLAFRVIPSGSMRPRPRGGQKLTPYTWALAVAGIIEPFSDEDARDFVARHPWLASSTAPARSSATSRVLERKSSKDVTQITTDATWRALALPGPSPERALAQQRPVHITSIDSLTGLRAFATTPTLLGALPAARADTGQWIVLLGENGSGKTSLLRSLALAFVEPELATKLLTNAVRMLRNGADGHVKLSTDGALFESRVQRTSGGDEFVEQLSPPPLHRPWVVGYGVRRTTALGEPGRSAELSGTANLHSLFDLPGALVYAPAWLNEQYRLVLTEREKNRREQLEDSYVGPDERVWRAIERAFDKLLNIEEIDASGRELFVKHREFGRVRFGQLSDGYLTTAGWLIDLVARWIAHNARVALPADILGHMTGLVLVDEIDLHLHPLWQMRIIDDVRALFPKLSFVVTTHNPLTVHGARPGEVFVMRRTPADGAAESSGITIEQRDIRPGSDVDRVLFDLFGVRDTLDPATRALLDQHLDMLRKGVARDDAARAAVEAEIAARLGAGGSALLDQRGQRVAPVGKLSDEAARRAREWFGDGG
jgi:energy-coupling factor transporter ATP-binding protein EcfA2